MKLESLTTHIWVVPHS